MKALHIEGFVTENRANVEENRTLTFKISSDKKDRHGTVLNTSGWVLDNYNRNPIVGYQHNVYGDWSKPDPDYVIGTGRAFLEGDNLMGEVRFEPKEINNLAEKIFRKVLHGTLRASSVGFIPVGKGQWGKEDEAIDGKNPTYYYAGQELLEWSIVNIPSNPEALKKSLKEQKAEFYQMIREILGESFTPEKIDKMTIGEVMKDSEGEIKPVIDANDDMARTMFQHKQKIDLDLITLNSY